MAQTQTQKAEIQPAPPSTIGEFIKTQLDQVRGIVPTDIPTETVQRALARISSTVQSMSHKVPGLKEAMKTPEGRRSLVIAVAECARLNLVPNAGPMSPIYLIPRKRRVNDNGTWRDGPTEVTAQLSVRGLSTLAERQGFLLEYGLVYEGEIFEYEITANGTHFRHVPALNRPLMDVVTLAPLQGAYVFATPLDGGPRRLRVVSLETIKKRRACSDAWAKVAAFIKEGRLPVPTKAQYEMSRAMQTPWVEWADSMVAKTIIAEALARHMIPLEEEIRGAIERSDAHDYVIEPEEERPDPMGTLRAAIAGPPVSDDFGDEDEPERRPESAQAPQNESDEDRYNREQDELFARQNPPSGK